MEKFVLPYCKFIYVICIFMSCKTYCQSNISLGPYVHSALHSSSLDYSEFEYITEIIIQTEYIETYWNENFYLKIHYLPKAPLFTTKVGGSYAYMDFNLRTNDGITGTAIAVWRFPTTGEDVTTEEPLVYDKFNEENTLTSKRNYYPTDAVFKAAADEIKASNATLSKAELKRRGYAPELKSLTFKIKIVGAKAVDQNFARYNQRNSLLKKADEFYHTNNCEAATLTFIEALAVIEPSSQLFSKIGLNNDDVNSKIRQCDDKIALTKTAVAEAQKQQGIDSTSTQPTSALKTETPTQTSDSLVASKEPTALDSWGNPIKTTANANTNNVASNQSAVYNQQIALQKNTHYAKEQHERYEAQKRENVDIHNATIVNKSNAIYQQSLSIDSDMKSALSQISPEAYGDPKALIQSGMNIMNTANGNLAKVKVGAVTAGVGLVTGLLGDIARAKAKKEAAAERKRLRKLEEERIKKVKMAFKKSRLAVFKGFPAGELPTTATASTGNNLYYFTYAYDDNQLMETTPKVFVSAVFAIGKYPDGTWPMTFKVNAQITALTPLTEIICGPFYSAEEAENVYQSFLNYLDTTQMISNRITYEGFNVQQENQNKTATTKALDFWGNPIKQ